MMGLLSNFSAARDEKENEGGPPCFRPGNAFLTSKSNEPERNKKEGVGWLHESRIINQGTAFLFRKKQGPEKRSTAAA